MRRLLACLAVPTLLVVACGDDGAESTAVADATTTTTAPTSTESTTSTSEPSGSSSSTTEVPEGDLPGERIEIFPYDGAEMGVVGVEAGDTLNVRSGPGVEFEVLLELDPLHKGISATGHNRDLGDSIWSEIETEGAIGWANTRYLLQPLDTTDITATLYPTPADRPTAPTMDELAELVAASYETGGPTPDVVIVDGPTVGDLGEVTVDIIGLGDDAQGGERLHIFAEPTDTGFTVRTVEGTALCSRGTSGNACV